jgi:predicted RNA-binding Zn-ribbon protein involved in translation (DUF1610 family)
MMPDGRPRWARKVPRSQIRRLYEADALGIVDEELIDKVGWALRERCDSILAVTAAHAGRVACPACGAAITRERPWRDDVPVACAACGWQLPWPTYHQTYRGKQLFAANAGPVFEGFYQAFPKARTPQAKMLLIDQLIHAFHLGLTDVGRPVAANLIEGSLGEVIVFLDELTSAGPSAAGLPDSATVWRRTLAAAAWAQTFGFKRDHSSDR